MSCHLHRRLLLLVVTCATIPLLGSRAEVGAADPPFKYVIKRFGFPPAELNPLDPLPVEPQVLLKNVTAVGSSVYGMNNFGDMVGCCEYQAINNDPDSLYYGKTVSWLYAFHYTRDGELLNLSTLWNSWGLQNLQDNLGMGYAEDINDLNVIVGASASGLGGTEEITCVRCTPPVTPGGSATFLGLRNGFGGPCSINIHGDVLGRDLNGTVLFWEATQQVFCVPELNGYHLTPAALDDNLQVAGFGGAPTKAWRYDPLTNKFTVLNKRSVATGMNDSGDVVGYGYFKPTDQHAFWWYFENGVERVKDLGTLGGKWSRAESINNATDRSKLKIVGTTANKKGQSRPFIYTPATGMVDLGLCIVGEEIAPGVIVPVDPAWGVTPIIVNDNGQIAASMAGGIPWQAVRLDPAQ